VLNLALLGGCFTFFIILILPPNSIGVTLKLTERPNGYSPIDREIHPDAFDLVFGGDTRQIISTPFVDVDPSNVI
jgi:hypothetical protein